MADFRTTEVVEEFGRVDLGRSTYNVGIVAYAWGAHYLS